MLAPPQVHARDKPLGPDVSLAEIAARTTGLSGASLRNLLNEAAIVAARRSKSAIGYDEIDYAIDRIQVGVFRSSYWPATNMLRRSQEDGRRFAAVQSHCHMGRLLPSL